MPAEGMLGGYTISGDRVGTDEHPLVRKHLPIDTDIVTTVLEPGVLLKEVEVKGEEDESDTVIEHKYAPWSMTASIRSMTPAPTASSTAASGRGC